MHLEDRETTVGLVEDENGQSMHLEPDAFCGRGAQCNRPTTIHPSAPLFQAHHCLKSTRRFRQCRATTLVHHGRRERNKTDRTCELVREVDHDPASTPLTSVLLDVKNVQLPAGKLLTPTPCVTLNSARRVVYCTPDAVPMRPSEVSFLDF